MGPFTCPPGCRVICPQNGVKKKYCLYNGVSYICRKAIFARDDNALAHMNSEQLGSYAQDLFKKKADKIPVCVRKKLMPEDPFTVDDSCGE